MDCISVNKSKTNRIGHKIGYSQREYNKKRALTAIGCRRSSLFIYAVEFLFMRRKILRLYSMQKI